MPASGSWASSGPDDEWGCSERGAGTPTPRPSCSSAPDSERALPLGRADLRSHRAASPGWASEGQWGWGWSLPGALSATLGERLS